jgi:hypothetical protein
MPDYPSEMTPALAEVLGMPNFVLHPFWMALREVGVAIKPRYEDEQAAALHFLIPFALAHGDDWRRHAIERLKELKQQRDATQAQAS